jgi:zinc/manganese transport system substrate-binding protein
MKVALIAALSFFLSSSYATATEKKQEVIVSFSILADFVKVIGREHVHVTSIVPPNSDPHVYQPTPEIPALLSHADLVIMNGLDFEGWIARLLESTKYQGVVSIATEGITPRILLEPGLSSAQAVPDPHAWHDVFHAISYVKNIRNALIKVDPLHQKDYEKHAKEYIQQLNVLDTWIQETFSKIPPEKRTIISAHDAFGYFAERYGLKIYALQGLSTESEPSARKVADLIDIIHKNNIRALFCENITNHRLLEQIAHETNIEIGGTLYSDALSDDSGPAKNYLELMHHNVSVLSSTLSQK